MLRRGRNVVIAGVLVAAVCGAGVFAWQDDGYVEPVPSFVVDPVISPMVYQGGTVVLRVAVTAAGRVDDIEVVSGVPAITGPVLEAVRKWSFTPARLNDRPVAATTTVVVHVALQRTVAPPPR